MAGRDIDRDIQRAIESGQKNKDTMSLVQNWCAHAKIEKFGGTGLVEMETGLPIGHHSLSCEYAPAGGMACWDLADSALHFYDQNCDGCSNRKPVGLPNLTLLLQKREQVRAKRKADEEAWKQEAATRQAERKQQRILLKQQLSPDSAILLDLVEELDEGRSEESHKKIVETSKLAPELFVSNIIEYFFALIENNEGWFCEAGLDSLWNLKVDPVRLTRCAANCLRHYRAIEKAATIIEGSSSYVMEEDVRGSLEALVNLADPPRSHFPTSQRRAMRPGPLKSIFAAQPEAVAKEVDVLLGQMSPDGVSVAARAISVLGQENKGLAIKFMLTLVAKIARARWLIDEDENSYRGNSEVIDELQDALLISFQHSPNEADGLLADFIDETPAEYQAPLLKVYVDVLHDGHSENKRTSSEEAIRVAIKRLLQISMTIPKDHMVHMELQRAFSPYCIENYGFAIREEMDAVLGAALLLDEKLQQLIAQNEPLNNALEAMERHNERTAVMHLRDTLIQIAALAVKGESGAIRKYIELYDAIPDGREFLKGSLIEQSAKFMTSPDGINVVLPKLYSCLVGASNVLRAAAARTIGEINRQQHRDLPVMLYEAFVALLYDPYVIVHHAAVNALQQFSLPEELNEKVGWALLNIVHVYGSNIQGSGGEHDEFVIDCIELYVRRHANEEILRGKIGLFIVDVISKLSPASYGREIDYLGRDLNAIPGFAAVVLKAAQNPAVLSYYEEHVIRALKNIPSSVIRSNSDELEAAALSLAPEQRELLGAFVEIMTRAGAWEMAVRITEKNFSKIPDTIRERVARQRASQFVIATKFEAAIASGKSEAIDDLMNQWNVVGSEIEKNRVEYEKRRNPLSGFLSSH